ncbi:hypothetical protein AAF712_010556 [Marasmius tenuissimus]|uniref:Uncharacterized protein n=1 Tax=Marasmius tenuissimus TaxID=585030 RepID=A0ABR2ZQ51_9AGAR
MSIPTPVASSGKNTTLTSSSIGGIVGGAAALVSIVGIVVVVCMRRRARRNREQRRQNSKVTALPFMMAGPGNSNYPRRVGEKNNRGLRRSEPPPPTADEQRGRGMDSQVLARLDMIMESVRRLEEADRDRERDRQEAPPDYTSNRS